MKIIGTHLLEWHFMLVPALQVNARVGEARYIIPLTAMRKRFLSLCRS